MKTLTLPLSEPLPPCAATIGFFDGVHLGHRYLIDQLKAEARSAGLQTLAITFYRHPRQVLQQSFQPQLLSTTEEKLRLLGECGLDFCAVLHFDRQLAALTAQAFMDVYLRRTFNVRLLLLGHDHHFGSDHLEGFNHYLRCGHELGVRVVRAKAFSTAQLTASSSAIRRFLQAGNVESAALLLGRPYDVEGVVGHGHELGRKLGFPTANLQIQDADKLLPADGVYAAYAEVDGRRHKAMVNIGTRPTAHNGTDRSIEAHLLHFSTNLYGRRVRLLFVRRLRDEQCFSSLEALARQLQHDARSVDQQLQA